MNVVSESLFLGLKCVVRPLPLWFCISHICLPQLDVFLHKGNHFMEGEMAASSHAEESALLSTLGGGHMLNPELISIAWEELGTGHVPEEYD